MSITSEITALQNDKTAIANAITAKGGTVASGDGFDDFASDIGSIPSGGTDYFQFAKSIAGVFRASTIPSTMVLNLPDFGDGNTYNSGYGQTGYAFYRTNGDCNLTINLPNTRRYCNFSNLFFQAYGIKNIKITGDLSGVYSYGDMLSYCSCAKTIDVEFDFTTATNALLFNNGSNQLVTDIKFKSKTLGVDCNIVGLPALNSTSLISIANGIRDDVQSKTLTLHNTPKALLSTIMGTVADGTFTQDASGTVTLEDFITNTKGWTIA